MENPHKYNGMLPSNFAEQNIDDFTIDFEKENELELARDIYLASLEECQPSLEEYELREIATFAFRASRVFCEEARAIEMGE
jgi:hypothetical protein